MAAVRYDLLIEQGATFSVVFEWREDDASDPPAGPLINTSVYDARMQIRTKPGGGLLGEFDADSGLTVANGIITLRIGADITVDLAGGVYDLELTNRGDPSDVVRLVAGKVSVSKQVTEDATP